jgi:hypothetical protein
MATEGDWASYARAVIDVAPPGRPPFRLEPDPSGATGAWPEHLVAPVVVVTAWNPDGIVLPPGDNQARNQLLVAELDRLGIAHWPAVGRDLDTPHFEEGVAVPGMTQADGTALGARHGQAAVYVWTPGAWAVASCTDDRRLVSGWRLAARPPLPDEPSST